MEISRKGIIFKVAYGWTEPYERPKDKAGICKIGRRLLLSIILWLLYLFVWWPIKIVFIVLGFIFGFPLGCRPAIFKGDKDDAFICMTHYKRWLTVSGRRVTVPNWLILGSMFLISIWSSYITLQKGECLVTILFVTSAILSVISAFCFYLPKETSEAGKLVGAYLEARKKKLCPDVIFVD